jgi:hypothetical protein
MIGRAQPISGSKMAKVELSRLLKGSDSFGARYAFGIKAMRIGVSSGKQPIVPLYRKLERLPCS